MNEFRCVNPECDGKKVIVSSVESMGTYFVECFDCGATGPEADTQSEAVRLWYKLGKERAENVN
jgi:hypothetical protein